MKKNPRHSFFQQCLADGQTDWFTPWTGNCWRFQSIEFPAPDQILNGEGAYKYGGRWNAPGSCHTLYGSGDDETAVKESAAVARYFGFPFREPRLLVAIHLKLQKTLDLTRADLRRKLAITLKEIRSEDWRKIQDSGSESLSQCLGRTACEAGGEAILIPSFAHRGGINVAQFPKNLATGSQVRIWQQDKLEDFLKK